jgi:hypothetical protein
MTFNLKVFAKERMLQLAGMEDRFRYEDISGSALRFRLVLGHGSLPDCDLALPAGALACAAQGASRPVPPGPVPAVAMMRRRPGRAGAELA